MASLLVRPGRLVRVQVWWSISLRLLALILCSNCSNTFNKVLTSTWRHTVKLLFATSEHHFSLLNMHHGWSKHFTSRYDPSTPFTPPYTPLHPLHPCPPCRDGWLFEGGGRRGGGGGNMGARSNCMFGGQTEWGSTRLVAMVVRETWSQQPTIHLAIIQTCFNLSSRVLLVSNLRRSNWKCTVKRFFKSTVMSSGHCDRNMVNAHKITASNLLCAKSQMRFCLTGSPFTFFWHLLGRGWGQWGLRGVGVGGWWLLKGAAWGASAIKPGQKL